MDRLRAYLQLVRLPAVFTAMADIFLGFLLVNFTLSPLRDFLLLLTASSCLYMAGMVWNDVFDRNIDAQQRPGRPIPSGRVPLKWAIALGIVLLVAGNITALVVGRQSALIAGVLTACVLGYDVLLKKTPLGPLVMGACRFLNVMLGASAIEGVWAIHSVWATPQTLVAAGLGVYITGVTWFARSEAQQSSRGQLAAAAVTVNLGLAALVALLVGWQKWRGDPELLLVLVPFLVIALTINRRLAAAIRDPVPATVQPAVKLMLLSLVTLDATLVLAQTGDLRYAVMTAALLAPAVLLGLWVYMT